MAIEITDEMRQAVLAEMCETQSHQLSMAGAFVQQDGGPIKIAGHDDKLAHMSCQRCGRVWIVLEDAGAGYEAAEAKLHGRLKDPRDIDALREKRKPGKG